MTLAAGNLARDEATPGYVITEGAIAGHAAEALNPGARLRLVFKAAGFRVTPEPPPRPSWEWGLALTGYGLAGALHEPELALISVRGNRIDYLRGDLTESLVNTDSGVQQVLTLSAPPKEGFPQEPAPLLFLEFAISGGLARKLSDDGLGAEFFAPGGEPVLRYGDLCVTDAEGRDIAARMELLSTPEAPGPGLRLLVEAMDAVYPVTISAKLTSPIASSKSEGAGGKLEDKRSEPPVGLLSAPPNDTCEGAEVISGGGPFPYLTALTPDVTDAATNGDPPVPSCQSNVTRSIWYTFTPTTTASYTISSCADAPTGTTLDDPVLAVYTSAGGCGGPLTQLVGGCDDDSCATEDFQAVVTTTLDAGTTYYIVAWQFGAAPPTAGNTAVQLRVSQRLLNPPSNDTCGAAEDIPGNGPFPYLTSVTGDITDATTAGDPPAPSCQSNVTRSIWYTFTPTTAADYTISSCADAPTGTTADDTVMAIYTTSGGCGGPFTEVSSACDDDSCSSESAQASVTANLHAGTTYHVLIWKLGAADPFPGNTAVQLRVTQRLPPSNDECASATPLALDTPVAGTTASAFDDYELSGSSCYTGIGQIVSPSAGRDVAYSFTAPSQESYSFRVTGYSTARNLVLHVAGTCPSGSPPVLVTSCLGASNRSVSGSAEEVMCLPLASGQTVFVFVDEHALTAGSTFRIEVNRCSPESEPNDTPEGAGPLACGVEGTISPADEADFHTLGNPVAGSRVFALADGVAANSNDFDLRVTTSTDTLEYDDASNDTPFGSLAPNVAGTPVTGVPPYVRMSHFSPIRTAEPYRLYVAVQPPSVSATSEAEPNGTIAQASTAANNYFAGSISALTDVDLFAFTAADGDLVLLGLDGDPLRNSTPINGGLALLNSAGSVLLTVNDTGSTSSTASGTGTLTSKTPNSPAEALTFRVTSPGTYYARVTGATVGDYLLSIARNCRVDPAADLGVTKTDSPDPVLVGSQLTYTLAVANTGPSIASNVILTDVLQATVSLVSATPSQGACGGVSTVTCFLGDIPAGSSAAVLLVVVPSSPGMIANTAIVTSAVADASAANDSAVETTQACSPPGEDTTCDGMDDDCDGGTDEDFPSTPTACGIGGCASTGTTSCVSGQLQDSCAPGTPAAEACDGVDNDCDGVVDNGNPGGGVSCDTGLLGICAAGTTACQTGQIVCVQDVPACHEDCDNLDNDCDGIVDGFATSCGAGACASAGTCAAGLNSCTPGTPAADDSACNGVDDDCDGIVDEEFASTATSCGAGVCASTGMTSCVAGQTQDSCTSGPPAPDVCDDLDNDCDGVVDDFATSCGVGACASTGTCTAGVDSCTPGTPAADDSACNGIDDDCDAATDEEYVSTATSCGVGACASTGTTSCVAGQVQDSCTPGTPAADDSVCNGVDDDCDGATDEEYVSTATSCGVGACASASTTSCVGGQVQDSCTPGTPVAEACDGADNDCDGVADNGNPGGGVSCDTGLLGICAAGTTVCQTGQIVCVQNAAPSAEVCDNLDNDCDGVVDGLATSCGVGACASTGTCTAGVDSCTPGTPAADDSACNGIDDDCDGATDEEYFSTATSCGVGACASTGTTSCVAGQVQDSCTPGTPAADDSVCNGVDDDCDGATDEAYVSTATSCGVGACASAGTTSCVGGQVQDSCTPGAPATDDSACNGIDDDCDGPIDEEFVSTGTNCGVGACASAGATFCVDGQVEDSCTAGTPSPEICDNLDNDCDGVVDNGNPGGGSSCNTGLLGVCSAGTTACQGGQIVCVQTEAPCTETCNNLDDDCDGVVDGFETSCGVGACFSVGTCTWGVNSCTPGTPAADDSVCNGVDDDCDGATDDEYVSTATSCGVGACASAGTTSCANGQVQDSCTPGTPVAEACDGADNDCDGVVDNGDPGGGSSCNTGLPGVCTAGTTACQGGQIVCVQNAAPSAEVCDSLDNDCDGVVDGFATSCGVGSCASTGTCTVGVDSCTPGTPAANDSLCNGMDDDCDGPIDEEFVSTGTNCGVGACASAGTTSCVNGQVQDSCLPGTPGPGDSTCNGIDDDCDGATDEEYVSAATSCGVGVCASVGATSCVNGQVQDSCTPGTPAADDSLCNGMDDDCDGATDEEYFSTATSCGVGACASTGATSCVSGQVQNSCLPGAPGPSDSTCNGMDDDCDGATDEEYVSTATSCGVGVCASAGATSCVNGQVQDSCAPGTPAANDSLCNGMDDDCDGASDEEFVSIATSCGVGVCASAGATSCVAGQVQDSCAPGIPAANDSLCNGMDDDCDASTDEEYVSTATSCGVGACASTGATSCVSGQVQDSCLPGAPGPSDSTCNGIDDDCDASTDEEYVSTATSCGLGACASAGTTSCVAGQVQDSCAPGTPAADDSLCNGMDDDCDGASDEEFVSIATSCGLGACASAGTTSCVNGQVQDSCAAGTPLPEICDSLDNDCDGSIDEEILAPTGSPTLAVDRDLLAWTALPGATDYDIVRGDLGGLVLSGGDFAVATSECLASNHAQTSLPYSTVPVVEGGFWFVVRGVNCGGGGTYDSGAPSQAAPRDGELASSCP